MVRRTRWSHPSLEAARTMCVNLSVTFVVVFHVAGGVLGVVKKKKFCSQVICSVCDNRRGYIVEIQVVSGYAWSLTRGGYIVGVALAPDTF